MPPAVVDELVAAREVNSLLRRELLTSLEREMQERKDREALIQARQATRCNWEENPQSHAVNHLCAAILSNSVNMHIYRKYSSLIAHVIEWQRSSIPAPQARAELSLIRSTAENTLATLALTTGRDRDREKSAARQNDEA